MSKKKLIWDQRCPKCKQQCIPQVNYPKHFYCFKGGHGIFEIVKEASKITYKFKKDEKQ